MHAMSWSWPNWVWVDYTIVGLIAISLLIGLARGFVKEAFSLLTWGVAFWVALNFSRELSLLLQSHVALPSARVAVAFLLLFLGTLMVGSVLTFLLGELVKTTGLTGSDRFAGMIFGLARGLLVVSALVLLAGLTPLPEDPWWRESQLIPPFQKLALWLRAQTPASVAGYIQYPLSVVSE